MNGLFSRLKDFSVPEVVHAPPLVSFGEELPLFSTQSEPEMDLDAELQAAHERGRSEAAAELVEKYEEEARTMATVHEREIEELRRRYDTEVAEAIKNGLDLIARDVARLVSDKAASAIAPMLGEVFAEKAVDALAAMLVETIAEGGAASVVVRGPVQLFEILQAKLPDKVDLLRHQEADDLDLTVETEDGLLVTRLSAWAAGLRKVME